MTRKGFSFQEHLHVGQLAQILHKVVAKQTHILSKNRYEKDVFYRVVINKTKSKTPPPRATPHLESAASCASEASIDKRVGFGPKGLNGIYGGY